MDLNLEGTVIPGDLFNQVFIGNHPILLCDGNNKISYSDTVKEGLNECKIHNYNNNYHQHVNGGIKFTDQTKWAEMKVYYITVSHYWEVTIPDDATVYVEEHSYKSDKIILSNRKTLKEMEVWDNIDMCRELVKKEKDLVRFVKCFDEDEYLTFLAVHPHCIKHIPEDKQTETIGMAVVCQKGNFLEHVKKQNLDICKIAIEKNIKQFKNCQYQDEEMCIQAVKTDGMLLELVKEQTEEICIEAVKQNYNAIKFVKVQTPEICEAAFKKNFRAFPHIEHKTEKMIKHALSQNGMLIEFVKPEDQTPEYCQIAIKRSFRAIEFAEHQTEELALFAVKKDGALLKFIKNKTPQICQAAIQNTIHAFKYIDNPDDETKFEILKKDGKLLEFIKEPSEEMCMVALLSNWKAIEFIENQTLEMCELAFNKCEKAFKFCKIKTKEMIETAIGKNGMLLEFVDLDTFNDEAAMEICGTAFIEDRRSIRFIPGKHQNETMSLNAVSAYPDLLKYIENPSNQVIVAAISKQPNIFSEIDNPTEDMCIAYVSKNGIKIKDVPKELQTDNVCYFAVDDTPWAIQHIENQTEDLCVHAVTKNSKVLQHCKVRTEKVLSAVLNKDGYAIKEFKPEEITAQLAEIAVDKWGYALEHVPEEIQTKELALKAVSKLGTVLQHVRKDLRDEEVCIAAVTHSPYAIRYVEHQTPEIKQIVMKNGLYFEHIQDPSPEQRIAACKKNGYNLKHIKKPTFDEIREALSDSKYAFNQVPNEEKNLRTCLTAIYCEQESYQHSKYKDDEVFNLMAFLINPNIENKLDDKSVQFIGTHPYLEILTKFIDDEEIAEEETKETQASKPGDNNYHPYKVQTYIPGQGWVEEVEEVEDDAVYYQGFANQVGHHHEFKDDYASFYS